MGTILFLRNSYFSLIKWPIICNQLSPAAPSSWPPPPPPRCISSTISSGKGAATWSKYRGMFFRKMGMMSRYRCTRAVTRSFRGPRNLIVIVLAAAPQRACQLRDRLATKHGGDVFGVWVHVGELHLGHLLRGQTVPGHAAVMVLRHGPAPVLVELQSRVPAPCPLPWQETRICKNQIKMKGKAIVYAYSL